MNQRLTLLCRLALASVLGLVGLPAPGQDQPAQKAPVAKPKPIVLEGSLSSLAREGIHTVKLQLGQNYAIDLRSPGFRTMARIEDDKGKVLSSFSGSSAFQPPADGVFRLAVHSPTGNSGEYTVTVTLMPPSKVAQLLTVPKEGLSFDELLTNADGLDKVRKRACKVYEVKLTADRTYTFDMLSKHFDAYLRLEDPAGKQVAQDDDSGSGNNARIKYRPKTAGVHRVIATSFAGGTGLFTLKVTEE